MPLEIVILVILWGFIVSSGTVNLQCVECKMDSLKYHEIFKKEAGEWASLDLPSG